MRDWLPIGDDGLTQVNLLNHGTGAHFLRQTHCQHFALVQHRDAAGHRENHRHVMFGKYARDAQLLGHLMHQLYGGQSLLRGHASGGLIEQEHRGTAGHCLSDVEGPLVSVRQRARERLALMGEAERCHEGFGARHGGWIWRGGGRGGPVAANAQGGRGRTGAAHDVRKGRGHRPGSPAGWIECGQGRGTTRAQHRKTAAENSAAASRQANDAADAPEQGSIIVVVATDAPLLPHQLKRVATRVSLGIGRQGGFGGNSSGDIFVAFSTANTNSWSSDTVSSVRMVNNDRLSPLFQATAQATEAAITNALLAAETTTGANDLRIYAMPLDRMLAAMRKYGRMP